MLSSEIVTTTLKAQIKEIEEIRLQIKRKIEKNKFININDKVKGERYTLKKENDEETKKTSGSPRWKNAFSLIKSDKYYENLYRMTVSLLACDLEKIANLLDNYDGICDSISDPFKAVTKKDLDRLRDLSYYIKVFPNMLICIAKLYYNPNNEIKAYLNSKELWKPKEVTAKEFSFYKEAAICKNPTKRYICNGLFSNYRKVKEKSKKELTPDDEAILTNGDMFIKLSDQARWGNIWTQMLSLVFLRDIGDPNQCLVNFSDNIKKLYETKLRYGIDLKPVQAILGLLHRYDVLPYYTTDTGKIIVNVINKTHDLPLFLPTVLSSLGELTFQEFGMNIRGKELLGAIKLRLEAAKESFGTYMLGIKSKYVDILKLIFDKCTDHMRCDHTDEECTNFVPRNVFGFREIWGADDEEEKLKKILLTLDQDYQDFVKFIQNSFNGDLSHNSELLRYAIMVANIYANPGIYYKTSLLLEAEASILPKVEAVINQPKVKEEILIDGQWYPFSYHWDSASHVINEVAHGYVEGLGKIQDKFKNKNWMSYFVSLLTNNSQGIKVSLEALGIDDSELSQRKKLSEEKSIRLEIFSKLNNARLIAFLLDQEAYQNFDAYLTALQGDGLCTIRYQNNRRARIVEIVPNIEQPGYSPLLFVFDCLKKIWPEIAVGKQKGGIVDMCDQLHATGREIYVNNASDVASMDASTQPWVSKMFAQLFIEFIFSHKLCLGRYFACGDTYTKIRDGETKKEGDGMVNISGMIQSLMLTLYTKQTGKNFKLKDGYFAKETTINNTFFASGQFNTTGQHTTLLALIGKCIVDTYKAKSSKPIRMKSRAFGDDSMRVIECSETGDAETTIIRDLIKLEEDLLKEFGFKIDIFVSKMFGDFLQQSAAMGVCVPKSARASILCDERGETKSRDPITAIQIMKNVLSAASQRYYFIENIKNYLKSIWICIRVILVRASRGQQHLDNSRWAKYLKSYQNIKLLIIPYITIFMPPINESNPPIMSGNRYLRPRSSTSMKGDIGWIWLMNSIFSKSDWTELTSTKPNDGSEEPGWYTVGGKRTLRPTFKFLTSPVVKDLDIDLVLGLLSYSRAAVLDQKRREITKKDIALLARKADAYKNNNRLEDSRLAVNILYDRWKIKVPRNITYAGQSETKIEQAMTSVEELSNELPMLDLDLYTFLLEVASRMPKVCQEKIDKFTIHYHFRKDEEWEATRKIQQLDKLPLLPGYHKNSDFGKLIHIAGSSLGSSGHISKINQFGSKLQNERFDYETALKLGVKIKYNYPEALETFYKTLSLNESEISEFRDLVNSGGLQDLAIEYSSQFSPADYFAISGDVSCVRGNYRYLLQLPKKANPLMMFIVRDLLFSNISTFELKKVDLTPSLFTFYYFLQPLRMRIGRNKVQYNLRYI